MSRCRGIGRSRLRKTRARRSRSGRFASPTYRLADQDAILSRARKAAAAAATEYLKADTILADEHIDHTIVVFGSTRISEPAAARRNVDALRVAIRANPDDVEILVRLATARNRILAKSHYYDVAREFGRLVGKVANAGRPRVVVMTGGGPGLMEAALLAAPSTLAQDQSD